MRVESRSLDASSILGYLAINSLEMDFCGKRSSSLRLYLHVIPKYIYRMEGTPRGEQTSEQAIRAREYG